MRGVGVFSIGELQLASPRSFFVFAADLIRRLGAP